MEILKLIEAEQEHLEIAMKIINVAKQHLKDQGVNQWQSGYPDLACIQQDIATGKGYLIAERELILGYLCIDFDGEAAYDNLNGTWSSNEKYVVIHRLAFNENARGRKLSEQVFNLIGRFSVEKGVRYVRVDTDEDNLKMQHILKKNGFKYCGTIWFDNSEKIAFDRLLNLMEDENEH